MTHFNDTLSAPPPFCVIDTETTGLSPWRGDDILELVLIHLSEDLVEEDRFIYQCQQPEMGMRTVQNTQCLCNQTLRFISGCTLVGHNIRFDYAFLQAFAYAHHKILKKNPLICTMHLMRQCYPALARYDLQTCCDVIGIEIKNRHTAIGDAFATCELFRHLRQKLNGVHN